MRFESCDHQNQLLPVTLKIYKSFDKGFETRRAFLDILQTLDKVWHQDLNLKLNDNGISGNLLCGSIGFVNDRKQSKHFSWVNLKAGVPQGSVLGSLLF